MNLDFVNINRAGRIAFIWSLYELERRGCQNVAMRANCMGGTWEKFAWEKIEQNVERLKSAPALKVVRQLRTLIMIEILNTEKRAMQKGILKSASK